MANCNHAVKISWCVGCGKENTTHTVTMEQIQEIVQLTINEARSSWGWGEGMDMGVLWLRIDRLLEEQ